MCVFEPQPERKSLRSAHFVRVYLGSPLAIAVSQLLVMVPISQQDYYMMSKLHSASTM